MGIQNGRPTTSKPVSASPKFCCTGSTKSASSRAPTTVQAGSGRQKITRTYPTLWINYNKPKRFKYAQHNIQRIFFLKLSQKSYRYKYWPIWLRDIIATGKSLSYSSRYQQQTNIQSRCRRFIQSPFYFKPLVFPTHSSTTISKFPT